MSASTNPGSAMPSGAGRAPWTHGMAEVEPGLRIHYVAHDLGLMVAYAYAQAYRDEVSHLVVIDAPLPGTAVFIVSAPIRLWHFGFHSARDVAEMLVAGRERGYLQAFFGARVFNPSAIGDADLDVYASAYSTPGAMRAAFEAYRAFDRDAADNRGALSRNGRLTVPALAVYAAISNSGPGFRAEEKSSHSLIYVRRATSLRTSGEQDANKAGPHRGQAQRGRHPGGIGPPPGRPSLRHG